MRLRRRSAIASKRDHLVHATIRVIVADDHPVVRSGVQQILAEAPDIDVVGQAGNARDLLSVLSAAACDVLVLDLSMPGATGTSVIEAVRTAAPGVRVLILTMHPAEHYAVRALRAGAVGYISKECAAEELVDAIRKVQTGRKYVTGGAAEAVAAHLGPAAERPAHSTLSNREYEVLGLLGRALSIKEIAQRLRLSHKTVSTYRSRLLEKLSARSTAELIRYAVKNGFSD